MKKVLKPRGLAYKIMFQLKFGQSLCRMEFVELLPIHGYSVDIFSCSVGSDRKQNTA